jgi:hypothetical protein
VIRVLASLDDAVDQVLYRLAVVKLFCWLPRWWQCDLARASIVLDARWRVGYWAAAGISPDGSCEAIRTPIRDEADLETAFAETRRRSIAWRW